MKKTGKQLIMGAMAVIFSTGVLLSCNDGSGTTDSADTTGTEYGDGNNMDNTDMNTRTDNIGGTGTNQVENGSFPADAGSSGNNNRPPEDSATRELKKHGTIQESAH